MDRARHVAACLLRGRCGSGVKASVPWYCRGAIGGRLGRPCFCALHGVRIAISSLVCARRCGSRAERYRPSTASNHDTSPGRAAGTAARAYTLPLECHYALANGATSARFQLSQPPHTAARRRARPLWRRRFCTSCPSRPLSIEKSRSLAACRMHPSKNSGSVQADRFGACTRPRAACFTLHVDTLLQPLCCCIPSRPGLGNSMRSCFRMF